MLNLSTCSDRRLPPSLNRRDRTVEGGWISSHSVPAISILRRVAWQLHFRMPRCCAIPNRYLITSCTTIVHIASKHPSTYDEGINNAIHLHLTILLQFFSKSHSTNLSVCASPLAPAFVNYKKSLYVAIYKYDEAEMTLKERHSCRGNPFEVGKASTVPPS